MKTVFATCGVFALGLTMACSSNRNYDKPTAMADTAAAAEVTNTYQGLEVDGLVEYGRAFPRRYTAKGPGHLRIEDRNIEWRSSERERDFSISADVVKSAELQCAARAGQNLCLELQIATVTGLTYNFRDANWAAGQNERILEVSNYMKTNFPQVIFAEKSVESIE